MKMSRLPALVPSAILAIALAVSGCGKGPTEAAGQKATDKIVEKAIEKQTGGKATVDSSSGKMEIKTAKGETMEIAPEGGAKLPEGFPKDVYLYEGASIKQSMKTDGAFNVILQTADARQKVIDKCKSKLEADGWKQAMSMDSGDSTVFQYEKGKLKAAYVFSQADGKTQAVVTVTEEKSGNQ